MGKKRTWQRKHLFLYFTTFLILILFTGGCLSIKIVSQGDRNIQTSKNFMAQGYFQEAIEKNLKTLEQYPLTHGDEALFYNGIIYLHPLNMSSDYKKSKESLQKLLNDYPNSEYKEEALVILAVLEKLKNRGNQIIKLNKEIKNYIDSEEQEEIYNSYEEKELMQKHQKLKRTKASLNKENASLNRENERIKKELRECKKQFHYATDKFATVLVNQLEECRKKVEQLKEIDLEIQKKKRESRGK